MSLILQKRNAQKDCDEQLEIRKSAHNFIELIVNRPDEKPVYFILTKEDAESVMLMLKLTIREMP